MGNKDVERRGEPLKVTVTIGGKVDERATERMNMDNRIDKLMEDGEVGNRAGEIRTRSQRGKLKEGTSSRKAALGKKSPGTGGARGTNDW